MRNIDFYIGLAVGRKKISEEQAEKEIKAIFDSNRSPYFTELALRHYFDDQTHPSYNDFSHREEQINNINNYKE